MVSEPMSDLKVARRVSLCCPQLEPVRNFKMLSLCLAFRVIFSTCFWNLIVGSNVTPKILGFCSTGRGTPFMVTRGHALACWVCEVSSVTVDFCADNTRLLPLAQEQTSSAWRLRWAAALSYCESVANAVKSSAYEVICSADWGYDAT